MSIVRYWEFSRAPHSVYANSWVVVDSEGRSIATFSGDHADETSQLFLQAGSMANALEAAILYGAHHLNCRSNGAGIDGCTCWKRTAADAFDKVKAARTEGV